MFKIFYVKQHYPISSELWWQAEKEAFSLSLYTGECVKCHASSVGIHGKTI